MLKHVLVIATLISKLALITLGSDPVTITSYGPEPGCIPGDCDS